MTYLKQYRFILGISILLLIHLVIADIVTAALSSSKQQQGIDLVIVLDRSGSMKLTDPQGLSTPAACFLLEQLALGGDGNRAAVVPFNNRAAILGQQQPVPATALTANLPGLAEWLQASSVDTFAAFHESSQADTTKFHHLLREQMQENGDTELGQALDLAATILQASGTERRKMIVLISDGEPYPNLADNKRAESLLSVLGKDEVASARKTGTVGSGLLRKFAQHILTTSVASLADKGIAIYPVAFQREGHENASLVNYLETIKEKTTGNRNIRQATTSTLVEQMMDFTPAGEEYLQFETLKGNARLVQAGTRETLKEYEFDLPDITRQGRIVLSFPTAKSAQRVRVELFRNGQLVADSEGKMPADIIHAGPVRRDGALAYHSFRFMRPEAAIGHWKLRLSDISRGGAEHLPDTDLLIDIRTSTELILTLETPSGQPRAGEPAALRFKLLGNRGGTDYPLSITRVDAFLAGRMPLEIRGISDKLRDVTLDGPVAVGNLADGIGAPGDYAVNGDIYFNTDPSTHELKVHVERNITIEPGEPVNAWLNKRGVVSAAPQGLDSDLRCDLPPLGDNFSLSYDGLEAATNSFLPVSGVLLSADPFIHKQAGKELNRSWVKLSPSSLRGLSAGKPLPLSVVIQLPEQVPTDVPDGLYESTLRLRQGSKTLASAALALTISIPRFAAEDEDINAPYLGENQEKIITTEHTIRYPGIRGNQAVVRIRSTSLPGIKSQVFVETAEGADLSTGERTKNLVYSPTIDSFDIPGKNSNRGGEIAVNANLIDPSLDGKDFETIVSIIAPHHRARTVRIVSHIRILPAWQPRLAGFLVLLMAVFFAWRSYRIWRERYLFVGRSCLNLLDSTAIRYQGDLMATFSYDINMLSLSFVPGPAARISCVQSGHEEDGSITVDESWTPNCYDQLHCHHSRSHRNFTLQVVQVPDSDEGIPGYGYEVIFSSLGSGRMLFIYLASAVVLGLMGVFVCINPYALLPWLGI